MLLQRFSKNYIKGVHRKRDKELGFLLELLLKGLSC